MAAIDLAAELRSWVQQEISAQSLGRDYRFTLIPQGGTADGGIPALRWKLYVLGANPEVGQGPLMITATLEIPFPPRPVVAAAVKQCLDGLVAKHDDLLRVGGNGRGG